VSIYKYNLENWFTNLPGIQLCNDEKHKERLHLSLFYLFFLSKNTLNAC